MRHQGGMLGTTQATPVDVAHVIQVALTPVFLLSGIAALLNVFATRLARVADQLDTLTQSVERADPQEAARLFRRLAYLRHRSVALDAAVILATIGSVSTGLSILMLFVGAMRDMASGWVLFGFFGFAVACTIAALGAFLIEALMAGRGVRIEVEHQQRETLSA